MNKSQMARVAELDNQIRNRDFPTLSNFSQEFGVSERTIRRDIDFLQNSLKAPLAIHPTRKGYHYTKDWEFPAIILNATNRACLLYQLAKHLKALPPSDQQWVIDQARMPPPPPAPLGPPGGIMTFATGSLPLPIRPPKKFDGLIEQIRTLNPEDRRFVMCLL